METERHKLIKVRASMFILINGIGHSLKLSRALEVL